MLLGGAVPLVKVVLLGDRDSRYDVNEPPKQHGDLVRKTDVVHHSHRLSSQAHSRSTEMGEDGGLDHVHQPG